MNLIIDFVLILGIILSILPIISIMRLKERSASHRILVILWVLVLNMVLNAYAIKQELSALQFITNFLQEGVWFLIPPLLYVYVKSIFLDQTDWIRKNIKHFAVFFVFFFDYTIPKSIDPNTQYIETIHSYFPSWTLIQGPFGILYFLMAWRIFYKSRQLMKYQYADIGEKGFSWVAQFLFGFLIVLIINLTSSFTSTAAGIGGDWFTYLPIFILVIVIAYLGFDGLTQAKVFLPSFLIAEEPHSGQVVSSYLKLSEQEDLSRRFSRCMRTEKMYLLKDLNSKSLAIAMETTERKLSAFFKEVLHSNFYDAINSFRVEEAKHILQSEALKNQSITGIALSCGFRSKSSFYRIFKKSTNLSPMDYVKMNEKESHHP